MVNVRIQEGQAQLQSGGGVSYAQVVSPSTIVSQDDPLSSAVSSLSDIAGDITKLATPLIKQQRALAADKEEKKVKGEQLNLAFNEAAKLVESTISSAPEGTDARTLKLNTSIAMMKNLSKFTNLSASERQEVFNTASGAIEDYAQTKIQLAEGQVTRWDSVTGEVKVIQDEEFIASTYMAKAQTELLEAFPVQMNHITEKNKRADGTLDEEAYAQDVRSFLSKMADADEAERTLSVKREQLKLAKETREFNAPALTKQILDFTRGNTSVMSDLLNDFATGKDVTPGMIQAQANKLFDSVRNNPNLIEALNESPLSYKDAMDAIGAAQDKAVEAATAISKGELRGFKLERMKTESEIAQLNVLSKLDPVTQGKVYTALALKGVDGVAMATLNSMLNISPTKVDIEGVALANIDSITTSNELESIRGLFNTSVAEISPEDLEATGRQARSVLGTLISDLKGLLEGNRGTSGGGALVKYMAISNSALMTDPSNSDVKAALDNLFRSVLRKNNLNEQDLREAFNGGN